jgi:hypothetical protein
MQQVRERAIASGCLVVLMGLFGCSRLEPRSPIVEKVEKVEQDGSGDLAAVSKDGMREWLGKHKDVAYQVDGMCKPVRQNATAQWADSTEGRLCTAARELAFWRGGPVTSDDKTYSPGLK